MVAPVAVVARLSASMLDTSDFAFARWYRGPGGWYYHQPGGCSARLLAPGEWSELDPWLHELCRGLYEQGIATTPSCQGHFHAHTRFEAIWRTLVHEAQAIRGEGLTVHHAGAAYRFRHAAYRLPWRRAADFCDEAMRKQNAGYIGFVLEPAAQTVEHLLTTTPATRGMRVGARLIDRDRLLIDVHIRTDSPDSQQCAWRQVTRHILTALRQHIRS